MNCIDLLLKDGEAATMLGCSKSTLWRRVSDGTIPRPVKIGGMSRWLQSEIKAVIEQAIAQRDAGPSGLVVLCLLLKTSPSSRYKRDNR
ncbi:MAG: helix-turn-helix domain-containing protein [Rhodobacteraceae bacterium]|nr:helix-turn-helix domain-containing protein [Paracoccaceae bacterium]